MVEDQRQFRSAGRGVAQGVQAPHGLDGFGVHAFAAHGVHVFFHVAGQRACQGDIQLPVDVIEALKTGFGEDGQVGAHLDREAQGAQGGQEVRQAGV